MTSSHVSEHRPACSYEMMERLGIEAGGGVLPRYSLTYATAIHQCQQCKTPEACRDWLERAPSSLKFAPSFCANADIFFELQIEQPRTPRSEDSKDE